MSEQQDKTEQIATLDSRWRPLLLGGRLRDGGQARLLAHHRAHPQAYRTGRHDKKKPTYLTDGQYEIDLPHRWL